jgi:hypothetical protein
MSDFPPLPELQELTLKNAVLLTGQKYYQSIPMSVCHFGTTLRIKMAKMIEICPTIPMRMETLTVLYEGKMTPGWERLVEHYTSFDGRLAVKRGARDVRTIAMDDYQCQNLWHCRPLLRMANK